MVDAARPLTRKQLAQFLFDHQAIRTFERMQQMALEITPDALEDLTQFVASSDARINEAIGATNRLADAIERLLAEPVVREPVLPDDLTPPLVAADDAGDLLPPIVVTGEPNDLSVPASPVIVEDFNLNPPPLQITPQLIASLASGYVDHGTLVGLSDDDHPQYPLAASTETISGAWTFTGADFFTGLAVSSVATPGISIGASVLGRAQLRMVDAGAGGGDDHYTQLVTTTTTVALQSLTDDRVTTRNLWLGTRSAGAWSDLSFGNATNNPTYTFLGTGTATFSGQVTALRFVPTSSTVATNGMYLSAANTVGLSANSTLSARLTSTTFETLLQLILSGDISPAQLTANTDDWNPTGLSTASVIRVSTDASRNLTGIQGGADGRVLILINVGSQPLVLVHDATSTAANRFFLASSTNTTVQSNGACILWYDSTSSRWRQITRIA